MLSSSSAVAASRVSLLSPRQLMIFVLSSSVYMLLSAPCHAFGPSVQRSTTVTRRTSSGDGGCHRCDVPEHATTTTWQQRSQGLDTACRISTQEEQSTSSFSSSIPTATVLSSSSSSSTSARSSSSTSSTTRARSAKSNKNKRAVTAITNRTSSSSSHHLRRKYKRKRRIPETERELARQRRAWQKNYEQVLAEEDYAPSLWSFESLFPAPVWDDVSIHRDLYSVRERDDQTEWERTGETGVGTASSQPQTYTWTSANTNQLIGQTAEQLAQTRAAARPATASSSSSSSSSSSEASLNATTTTTTAKMKSSFYGGFSMMRIWRDPRLSSTYIPPNDTRTGTTTPSYGDSMGQEAKVVEDPLATAVAAVLEDSELMEALKDNNNDDEGNIFNNSSSLPSPLGKVDLGLTRLVEDRLYGYRRTEQGEFYETSLMGDGAVQFRDGVRLGNPLRVNADRLNYFAKRELRAGRVEEAQEFYEMAVRIDPRDGRAYLGLSRCAERRRDFTLAREYLKTGLANSRHSPTSSSKEDRGGNPFLLQALGCLEEKMGHLTQAEACYVAACKSRSWHAAAWVALAQLRTRKLGQSAEAGRALYHAAVREIQQAGQKIPAHVYTAWASLEHKKATNVKRARELYREALQVDPKCSAAYLQLGVMEAESENWDEAQKCFDRVLKFDQRNSRVLQAYALMETKRPDGSSRKAIDLFERACKANPRDAGVWQAYGLYVSRDLGDVLGGRELLERATKADKRHAAAWQAWGVLETQEGHYEEARRLFQQGIWSCAQVGGGQSGGYHCARLWQAWGVLEANEEDYAAARRCFNRALDADGRNLAAFTAWALMEAEQVGSVGDGRAILERGLSEFAIGSAERNSLWRTYELLEQRLGNKQEAQRIYQRYIREQLVANTPAAAVTPNTNTTELRVESTLTEIDGEVDNKSSNRKGGSKSKKSGQDEVEVVRWNDGGSLRGEVWMNDRAIESKLPPMYRRSKSSSSGSRNKVAEKRTKQRKSNS